MLAQALLLNCGPGVGAYSAYLSTSMQVALQKKESQFKIDEYTYFDHVYLMTVNLTKMTK